MIDWLIVFIVRRVVLDSWFNIWFLDLVFFDEFDQPLTAYLIGCFECFWTLFWDRLLERSIDQLIDWLIYWFSVVFLFPSIFCVFKMIFRRLSGFSSFCPVLSRNLRGQLYDFLSTRRGMNSVGGECETSAPVGFNVISPLLFQKPGVWTTRRNLPPGISVPYYANGGRPGMPKRQSGLDDPVRIAGMRTACRLARHTLNFVGRHVQVSLALFLERFKQLVEGGKKLNLDVTLNQSTDQPTNQPIEQPTNQSINQSIDQPINQWKMWALNFLQLINQATV